jgi:hypothetical protein
MTDRPLVFEDFADKVGDVFTISEEGVPAIPLTLKEATPMDPKLGLPGVRPPFSLIFVAAGPDILMQRMYCLKHDRLGEQTICLVPVGMNKEGVSYQALFN